MFYKMRIIQKSNTKAEINNYPTEEDFVKIFQEQEVNYEKNNKYYSGKIETTKNYFWLCVEYNNLSPRREKLHNIQTGTERENTRSKVEVELVKQAFFLYHYAREILYVRVENFDDRKILLDILKERDKINKYSIESIYTDSKKFMDILDSVTEIKFADADNLFGTLRKYLNIDADSQPDAFSVFLKYKNRSKSKIENFFSFLFASNNKFDIKNLVIKGKDKDNFGVIFNQDTFFKKIIIKPKKTDEDIWDTNSVKEKLLEIINKEEELQGMIDND